MPFKKKLEIFQACVILKVALQLALFWAECCRDAKAGCTSNKVSQTIPT